MIFMDSTILEVRHLRTLAALRDTGSLVRAAQLLHLTQAVHAFRGHLDPIRVADEVLLTWPFDIAEPGG